MKKISKKKNKPSVKKDSEFKEIEIKFSSYSNAITKHWIDTLGIDEELATKLVSEAMFFINNHLKCTKCEFILCDEDFYPQKAQFANRCRSQRCKSCWKDVYTKSNNIKMQGVDEDG